MNSEAVSCLPGRVLSALSGVRGKQRQICQSLPRNGMERLRGDILRNASHGMLIATNVLAQGEEDAHEQLVGGC